MKGGATKGSYFHPIVLGSKFYEPPLPRLPWTSPSFVYFLKKNFTSTPLGGAPEFFMSKNIPEFRISNFIVIHVPMILNQWRALCSEICLISNVLV